jgi:hypothetical protein
MAMMAVRIGEDCMKVVLKAENRSPWAPVSVGLCP